MDYKDTLNLPRTEFAMKADLVTREPERLAQWENQRLYARIQTARAGAPRFILHYGPPFANGDAHVGHVLNHALKDFVVRFRTLRGFRAPFVPGWDCHGLPIEFKVTQEMRKAGQSNADPVAIRRACDAYARRFIDIQRAQFQRLGVLGDWSNPYLTLDRAYEAEELRLFADLIEQGYVYRGKKPVYWSIPCRTALAEAEVEYQDHLSPSIYVKFPVVDQPGLSVLIWTTTPWTLPANLAVAYHSKFSYSLVRVGSECYILSTLRLPEVAAQCAWDGYEIIQSLTGEQVAQIVYQHPFCARTGRLHAGDEFVDNVTGTGFVHIAPGHGLEDYRLGLRVGLPIYSPVDDQGCLTHTPDLPADHQMPADLLGKSILEKHGKSDANEAVLHALRAAHALVHQENYHHSYPHCWRSKTPVIFRAMDQWFIAVDHRVNGQSLRQRALDAIARVQWLPDWGRNRIESAVASRPDWCISRQRSWGVPIPAFHDAQGGLLLDPGIVRRAADLCEQRGTDFWFETPVTDLWALLKPESWSGPDPVGKSTDTLDVWIDSGSSSRTVTARRPELRGDPHPFQADLYLEGSDQHRGWFQSSLLLSLAANGAAPFKTVLTHGFIVDADREKIAKSKQGGYEKPQTLDRYVAAFGADVLRLWIASQDFRTDTVVSEERLRKVSEAYRFLRNTLRFQLSNLYDFDPARDAVAPDALDPLDRWVLAEFARLETDVLRAYEACEFHLVYQRVSQFAAVELSALYHDIIKDRLYTDPAGSHRRRSTQTALHRLVTGLCRMLSPLTVYTADEAWTQIPGQTVDSVHLTDWPDPTGPGTEAEQALWTQLLALRTAALPELEKARQAKLIGKALDARLEIHGPTALLGPAPQHAETLRELLNVSQLEVVANPAASALAFAVHRAAGQKCERCWHWETDVGTKPSHPTLCRRCASAVAAFRNPDRPG
ncbi:MAG TPA: isoleucine--tRNA ligase [Verrucomicrobiota bacterium]|nr:isoleucine--tRNA ligase [Verrucomicrobiota bacterium]HNU50117.1 isoleucine--tRNA ligase [Verrucomicrobiota bacterium]